MKNKKLMIVVISLLIVIIAFTSFVLVGKANIKNKMDEYLKNKGYSTNEIAKVKVSHSAINYILGYDVWGISVEYVDEPDVLYFYSYKNKKIVTAGVGGKGAEKENLKHDEDYKAEHLFSLKNQYIGNASANSHLLTALEISKLGTYTIELKTDEKPYILTINFSKFDFIPRKTSGITDDMQYKSIMYQKSIILLTLIDNADEIKWNIKTDNIDDSYTVTVEEITKEYGNIKDYGKSLKQFYSLLVNIGYFNK